MTMSDTHHAIEAVWRIESAQLIAGLTRIVRDVGVAEDLAQDALVIALERWPQTGIPNNPGAWLMATARDRARVPRPGADRRPAHRAGEADPSRGARPFRGPSRGRTRRPFVVGARGRLPGLQRGLRGDRR